jgi:hypothetical protein
MSGAATSTSKNSATRFADTTALFEFHAGTGATRARARELLRERALVATSEHVRREWNRIIFTSVSAFLEAVDTEPDLAGVLRRMGVGFGREPSQRWLAAALMFGGKSSLDTTHIRIRALQMLRGEADARLRRTVSEIRADSHCGIAAGVPRQTPEGSWTLKVTCKRREGICRHEERLGTDLTRWDAGAKALRASSVKSHRDVGSRAAEMSKEPAKRTGVNCFGRTGDLAIALDCRPGETLVTTDRSFEVLGPAMGFGVTRIPSRVTGA